jgi:hypothetical protein
MPQSELGCIQTKIGECAGCNIVSLALSRAGAARDYEQLTIVAEETARDWCPQGTMVAPLVRALRRQRPSQSIW